jgi:pimeloyl-ACP methyl ester carboxylesterase
MGEAAEPLDQLVFGRVRVGDTLASYAVSGEGRPLLFLHGWALAQHSYRHTLERLVRAGYRVYAPSLPGFGGTPGLPGGDDMSFERYAKWVDDFCVALELSEPAFCVGHSFGGGVAIRFAHDYPERVRCLVLVNSVGGSVWQSSGGVVRTLAERPLWDWGLHFPGDILPLKQMRRVLPVVLEDALPNLIRNPMAVLRVSKLARDADLAAELDELKERRLPVVVLWGDQDRILPMDTFEELCRRLGTEGAVVHGSHSWLLADPDTFAEVLTNAVSVAELARDMEVESEGKPRELKKMRRARPRDVVREGPIDPSVYLG